MVDSLPDRNIKTHLGMEIVVFFRYTPKESFPLHDYYVNGVTVEESKSIGRSKAYY